MTAYVYRGLRRTVAGDEYDRPLTVAPTRPVPSKDHLHWARTDIAPDGTRIWRCLGCDWTRPFVTDLELLAAARALLEGHP